MCDPIFCYRPDQRHIAYAMNIIVYSIIYKTRGTIYPKSGISLQQWFRDIQMQKHLWLWAGYTCNGQLYIIKDSPLILTSTCIIINYPIYSTGDVFHGHSPLRVPGDPDDKRGHPPGSCGGNQVLPRTGVGQTSWSNSESIIECDISERMSVFQIKFYSLVIPVCTIIHDLS